MERDFFMTPEQAKEWGLVDLIVEKNPLSQRGEKVAGNGSGVPA
jgi:ATP-dependent protease ClpP protease subunit